MPVPMHLEPDRAKVIEVIAVDGFAGDGSDNNPVRMIDLYFSLDGRLLAQHDPLNDPEDPADEVPR